MCDTGCDQSSAARKQLDRVTVSKETESILVMMDDDLERKFHPTNLPLFICKKIL